MPIDFNEWRPDTCQCVIEYEFDTAVPVDQRLHTVRRVVVRGPEHSTVLVGSVLYQATRDENVRKNRSLEFVQQVSLSAKAGVKWAFTVGRVLQISFEASKANVSQKTKTDIQTLCNAEFGTGKVEVL